MSDHSDYSRSRVAFRPSSYSTGIQEIQPYTPDWPQGMEYGGWWSDLVVFGRSDSISSDVGGTCVDSEGALGPVGAKVSCHRLAEVYGVREPGEATKYEIIDDDPNDTDTDWTPFVLAVLAVGGGVAGAAAFTRYKKTGKVF